MWAKRVSTDDLLMCELKVNLLEARENASDLI